MSTSTFFYDGRTFTYHDVSGVLGQAAYEKMPFVARVLAENLLRNRAKGTAPGDAFGDLNNPRVVPGSGALALTVPRVILPDSSGIPVLMDLAALRSAVARGGGNPSAVGPSVPIDFIVDHSLQVDVHGRADAAEHNLGREIERNHERYAFLKWAQKALGAVRIFPPGSGIIHQVHLEQIAQLSLVAERDGVVTVFPDFALGGDSHTPMVNALGVLGWGVGGIEAEAVVLGQPCILPKPEFVGVKLSGRLRAGVTMTDAALTITRILREASVVGAFIEFFGEAAQTLSIPDRATLANMAPEYGATTGFWPVDTVTLAYLALTGRTPMQVGLVEAHCRAAGFFRSDETADPRFDRLIAIDLASIGRTISGPGKPHFGRTPGAVAESFRQNTGSSYEQPDPGERLDVQDQVSDGAVVLAAITSCTNTANPAGMICAGLVARNAVARGLRPPSWVKTSLAPGSRAVTAYLEDSGLMLPLQELGFNVIGYGCTTCGGKSGPLLPAAVDAIERGGIKVASVLSGNRNFDGRIHRLIPANYLCSPALVVAYALSGSILSDLDNDPLGRGADGKPVYLHEIWPSETEIADVVGRYVTREVFVRSAAYDAGQLDAWSAIVAKEGTLFPWDPASQYILEPPFFSQDSGRDLSGDSMKGARVLGVFDDALTTDHISPGGEIPAESAAGQYLREQGVTQRNFNTYVGRRGNHHVMTRGTYANIRLRNRLVPGHQGGWTRQFPDDDIVSIFSAAQSYARSGMPAIILAGRDFGSGSSRDWAAKGQALLGIRAIIARSFERIHRSNLIGMGILPLLFAPGASMEALGLDGSEEYDFGDVGSGIRAAAEILVSARHKDGRTTAFTTSVDVRSPAEGALLLNGGIYAAAFENAMRAK